MRARGAPEDHEAEGTVRLEPAGVHPGDALAAVVELTFKGGAPASLWVGCSPPEDFVAEESAVAIRPDGATVTVPMRIGEQAELGRYYAQVVYSDDRREHFEAEAALELTKHWVTIDSVTATPARASPGDSVDIAVRMSFGGEGRVRGHARGRLQPKGWSGDEEQAIKLSKERSSVATEREVAWHVKLPREAPLGSWAAEVEFSSSEGMETRKVPDVLQVVPRRAVAADAVIVEPVMLAPGEPFVLRARIENTGVEPLDVRAGGELAPEAGGSAVALEERPLVLAPGESRDVEWAMGAPGRTGRWLCRVRARAERCQGADPAPTVLDVRPPHLPDAISVIPSSGWAAPGDEVELVVQLVDAGSHPGSETSVTLVLEDDAGTRASATWRGPIGAEPTSARATVRLAAGAVDAAGTGSTARYAAIVVSEDGQELLRVPGAVRVRRRIALHPHIIKAVPEADGVSDCLVPGERIVASVRAGALTLHELTSGCRLYTREGGTVVGVDSPMDSAFWGEALEAELRAYTDIHARLERLSRATRAESAVVHSLTAGLGAGAGRPSRVTADARALAAAFDPGARDIALAPKEGAMAQLAAYLGDPMTPTPVQVARERLGTFRSMVDSLQAPKDRPDPRAEARSAAAAATGALDSLSGLLDGAARRGALDERALESMVALLASAGFAHLDLHLARAPSDPFATPWEIEDAKKVINTATASMMVGAMGLLAVHRARRQGVLANLQARASHAAVARGLRVEAAPVVAHSGDASELVLELVNGSRVDLELRINIALPSSAWAVLEPPSRGTGGLASIGPVTLAAGAQARLTVLVYVPTTARLDRYVLPVEVQPEHVDLAQERGGETLS